MAASPPLISAPAMALLLGLDAGLMLAVLVLSTSLAPFFRRMCTQVGRE